jgi:hypothetical protein
MRESEEEMESERVLQELLMDEIPLPALLLDQNGQLLNANRPMEQLINFSLHQLQYLSRIKKFSFRCLGVMTPNEFALTVYDHTFQLHAKRQRSAKGYHIFIFDDGKAKTEAIEEDPSEFSMLVGKTPAFLNAVALCKKASAPGIFCMLHGESGTGKETLAKCMHKNGPFADRPFLYLRDNHEFGEFIKSVPIASSGVHRGTVYIDEFTNLSGYHQERLQALLQRSIGADGKIICASSADLNYLLVRGELNNHLYYSLNAQRIEIPALRQRRKDIPLLAEYLLTILNKKFNRALTLSCELQREMQEYNWLGNMHELENFLICAVRETDMVEGALPVELLRKLVLHCEEEQTTPDLSLAKVEKNTIIRALNLYGSNTGGKKAAARALGIGTATLYRKIAEYGIQTYQHYDE